MKNGYRSQSRLAKTPSAICLPSPKPPITAPRSVPEVLRALPLPQMDEPQPVSLTPLELPDEVKSRRPKSASPKRRTARAAANEPMRPTEQNCAAKNYSTASSTEESMGRAMTAPATVEPLPRSRALTVSQPSRITRLGKWLRSLIMVKRSAAAPGRRPAVSQMKALRRDVLTLQKTLDRMIENSRA